MLSRVAPLALVRRQAGRSMYNPYQWMIIPSMAAFFVTEFYFQAYWNTEKCWESKSIFTPVAAPEAEDDEEEDESKLELPRNAI